MAKEPTLFHNIRNKILFYQDKVSGIHWTTIVPFPCQKHVQVISLLYWYAFWWLCWEIEINWKLCEISISVAYIYSTGLQKANPRCLLWGSASTQFLNKFRSYFVDFITLLIFNCIGNTCSLYSNQFHWKTTGDVFRQHL